LQPSRTEAAGSIVLIEDDVLVAQAWQRLLVREGYDVSMAATVREAHDVADRLTRVPDLIISDFHLADGSSGIVAVRDLRAAFESEIPAFIVTGDTSKIADEARALKNSKLMRKPVNTEVLLDLVHRAVLSGKIKDG
jgi:DNA-binding response OmpR family regulator